MIINSINKEMESTQINKHKLKHILISYENFEKLKRFGYASESMNDVISRILEKGKMLEFKEFPNSRTRF